MADLGFTQFFNTKHFQGETVDAEFAPWGNFSRKFISISLASHIRWLAANKINFQFHLRVTVLADCSHWPLPLRLRLSVALGLTALVLRMGCSCAHSIRPWHSLSTPSLPTLRLPCKWHTAPSQFSIRSLCIPKVSVVSFLRCETIQLQFFLEEKVKILLPWGS